MATPSILYLHGFASGPSSAKATLMKSWAEGSGVTMAVPDLNGSGFRTLTVASQLRIARDALATLPRPVVVVGSSLGGYLAALLVEARAGVDGALMMCPAFDFARRLGRVLGEEALAQWKQRGVMSIYHHSEKEERDVGFEIIEEAPRHTAMPRMTVPATIVHGTEDAEVPVELSRLYARDNPGLKLVEVEDDHTLMMNLPRVVEETHALLDRVGATWSPSA
jgi:predicted esterase YcpF (UPF0227 family)